MNNRFRPLSSALVIVTAVLLLPPDFSAAQAPVVVAKTESKTTAKTPSKTSAWTPASRTPDGQPVIEGYWNSISFTPMERPAKYGTREFLTDEETEALYKAGVQHSYEFTNGDGDSAETPIYDGNVYALNAWQNGIKPNRRSSLIVDPPDGRIPPLTPEAQKLRAAAMTQPQLVNAVNGGAVVHADNPADTGLGTRCLTFGGPPMLPSGYNSNSHIVQGPGYVMIEWEWSSEVRIIPLDGRPHVSQNIRQWHGDSRGHWEGNTLVVDTIHFRPGATYQNANPQTLHIIERFTRIDADTIEYKFTIDDPATWTKSWSGIVPLTKTEGPMFEYACSEGNNALINILEGARVAEKSAKEKAAGTPISHK